MLTVDEITKSLPPLRDDEPTSLRQDIVDEILDHLECGLRRELLMRHGDERAAMQRVLDVFGDPRQIARKLWYQAMWSKIMTQRLVVGSAVFSMVTSIVLVVLVGWMMQQQQLANAALLKELVNMQPRRESGLVQRDLRWNALQVKVTLGRKDGPAAEGFQMTVARIAGVGQMDGAQLSQTIDKTGVADCGYVEPGRYEAIVKSPWGERSRALFTIQPGTDHVEQIIAPERPPELTRVSLSIEGLPEKATPGVALAIVCRPTGPRTFADRSWDFETWKSMPVLLLIPSQGMWVANLARDDISGSDDLTWLQSEMRTAKWEKADSILKTQLPANRYSFSFELIQLLPNESLNDPAKLFGYFRFPTTFIRNPFEFIAERDQSNDWSISIPQDIVENLVHAPGPAFPGMPGGGFF